MLPTYKLQRAFNKNLELLNFTYHSLILHRDFTLCAPHVTRQGWVTLLVLFVFVGLVGFIGCTHLGIQYFKYGTLELQGMGGIGCNGFSMHCNENLFSMGGVLHQNHLRGPPFLGVHLHKEISFSQTSVNYNIFTSFGPLLLSL